MDVNELIDRLRGALSAAEGRCAQDKRPARMQVFGSGRLGGIDGGIGLAQDLDEPLSRGCLAKSPEDVVAVGEGSDAAQDPDVFSRQPARGQDDEHQIRQLPRDAGVQPPR